MKKIVVTMLFAVFLTAILAIPSMSQMTIGVEVGDHFQWVGSYFSNATGLVPYQLAGYSFWENASYVNRTVTAIEGTNVTFSTTVHYTNGTDDTYTEVLPAYNETGYNEHGFIIVPANLEPDDIFTEAANWGGTLWINSTVQVDYGDGPRETGTHYSTTGAWATVDRQWLFDKETGIVVSASLNATGQSQITTYTLDLVDTNVWVIPEFPTGTVMLFVFVAVTVCVDIYRRRKLKR